MTVEEAELRKLIARAEAAIERIEGVEQRLAESVAWLTLVEQRTMQLQSAQVLTRLPPNIHPVTPQ